MSCPNVARPRYLTSLLPPMRRAAKGQPQCLQNTQYGQMLGYTQVESLFVNALVRASTCSRHGTNARRACSSSVSLSKSEDRRRATQRQHRPARCTRTYHNPYARMRSHSLTREPSRDDYRAMVDYYRESYHSGALPPSTASELVQLGAEPPGDERKWPWSIRTSHGREICPRDAAIQSVIDTIDDENATSDDLYASYETLPFPGVSSLPLATNRKLLRRLSIVQKKNKEATLRYLSVIDDMKAAKIPLTVAEWSSAIHLAGRCFSDFKQSDAESALKLFKEMEEDSRVEGSSITFNILFDVLVKTGRFAAAELVLGEMEKRGLGMNRFSRVGLIYYAGLRQDGNGVRKKYLDLVDAGEVVDTVVLNCVIASLLRAGELPAAEQTYERMKAMHSQMTGRQPPMLKWKASRELGRALDRASQRFEPSELRELQDQSSLAPDVHTYVIFIEHHVSFTGDLRRVATLLDEMHSLDLPVHGRIFVDLFRGFFNHGGVRYTSWTVSRLENVWSAFLFLHDKIPDTSSLEMYVGKWVVIWALRAFGKCCGRQRTTEIWEELKSRWKLNDQELAVVSGVLGKVLAECEARQ
jgi:pentatricopeptide repeat protein